MERKWRVLIVVCVAVFMLLLDITVVNVALPEIDKELSTSFTDLQWVVDAYALTLPATMLNAGSLGDRRAGGGDRAARGRGAHDVRRLALDLLRQHPDRDRLRGGRSARAARVAQRGARRRRRARAGDLDRSAVRPRARALPRL